MNILFVFVLWAASQVTTHKLRAVATCQRSIRISSMSIAHGRLIGLRINEGAVSAQMQRNQICMTLNVPMLF